MDRFKKHSSTELKKKVVNRKMFEEGIQTSERGKGDGESEKLRETS